MTLSPALAILAVPLLAVLAVAAGRALTIAAAGSSAARQGGAWSLAADGLGGLAALHLALLALDATGIPWTRPTLAAAWLLPATVAFTLARARRGLPHSTATITARRAPPGASGGAGADSEEDRSPAVRGIGTIPLTRAANAVALGIVALYAALAASRWIATPDFVYHWGVKGLRFHLARGIDWAFLTDPLHLAQHPDYPNLLPGLYAAAAAVAGGFSERAQMLWSALFFAALLAGANETWERLGTAPAARRAGIVAVAAATAMFGIGYRLAGGGEMAIAAALAVALPVLAAPSRAPGSGTADALRLGFAAAFAAGAKLEGLALAAVLIGIYLVRLAWDRRPRAVSGQAAGPGSRGLGGLLAPALAAALPAALVVAPWLAAVRHHGILSPNHPGGFDPARAAAVLPAVAEALGTREWHGFGWLLAASIPVLSIARRSRWIGVACAFQLGFYLWVYLASPLEPRFYVLSSLPRLLFHLVPAALIGAVALLGYPSFGKRPVSAWPQKLPGSLT